MQVLLQQNRAQTKSAINAAIVSSKQFPVFLFGPIDQPTVKGLFCPVEQLWLLGLLFVHALSHSCCIWKKC